MISYKLVFFVSNKMWTHFKLFILRCFNLEILVLSILTIKVLLIIWVRNIWNRLRLNEIIEMFWVYKRIRLDDKGPTSLTYQPDKLKKFTLFSTDTQSYLIVHIINLMNEINNLNHKMLIEWKCQNSYKIVSEISE